MTQQTLDQLTDLTGYAICNCGSRDICAGGQYPEMVVHCRGCGARTTYTLTINKYGREVVEVTTDE